MKKFLLALTVCLAATAVHAFNLPFAPGQATFSAGGAATLNQDAGIVTTAALTTAGQVTATFTINCNQVNQATTASVVMVTVGNGTNTGGIPTVAGVTLSNSLITVVIMNDGLVGNVFNGTLKISFIVFN
jgi:hypothetical protein